jgi:hypothetical protein
MGADSLDIKSQTTPETNENELPAEETEIPVLDEGFTVLAEGKNPLAEYVLARRGFCCANIFKVLSSSMGSRGIPKGLGLSRHRAAIVGARRSGRSQRRTAEYTGLEIFSKRISTMCASLPMDMIRIWVHSVPRRTKPG